MVKYYYQFLFMSMMREGGNLLENFEISSVIMPYLACLALPASLKYLFLGCHYTRITNSFIPQYCCDRLLASNLGPRTERVTTLCGYAWIKNNKK